MAKDSSKDTPKLYWKGRPAKFTGAKAALVTDETITPSSVSDSDSPVSRLIEGDNLHVMEALITEGLDGSADLIYIDPPFASKAVYTYTIKAAGVAIERHAYSDTWQGGMEGYLEMLMPRLRLMSKLLKDTGAIFVHCDWRADSYIRVLMDEIFGAECFLNSIVWHYGGRGAKATSGQFPRNHDTILVYGKTTKAKLNKVYTEKSMTVAEAKRAGIREDARGRFFKTAPRGDYTDESIEELKKDDRVHITKNGKVRIKYFLEFKGGRVIERKLVGDVWDDIPDAMHSPAGERTSYATQKPEALLERIIESATDTEGLVCDFFGGSGTSAVVAGRSGRRWILCEESPVGLHLAKRRLINNSALPFTVECIPAGSSGGVERAGGERSKEVTLTVSAVRVKKMAGGFEASLSLDSYSLHDFPADVKVEKNAEALRTLEHRDNDDFTVLVDYWSVDWNFDGDTHRSRWQSALSPERSGKEGVIREASALLKDKPGPVSVRVVDIFGNLTEEILEVE